MIIVSWAQRSEGVEQGLLPETNRTDRETNFWPGRSLSIDRRKLRRATRVTRREMPTVGKMSIRHGLEDARLSSSLGFRSFFTWYLRPWAEWKRETSPSSASSRCCTKIKRSHGEDDPRVLDRPCNKIVVIVPRPVDSIFRPRRRNANS